MNHLPITWYTHSIAALTEALNSIPAIWLNPPYGTTSKALRVLFTRPPVTQVSGSGL